MKIFAKLSKTNLTKQHFEILLMLLLGNFFSASNDFFSASNTFKLP